MKRYILIHIIILAIISNILAQEDVSATFKKMITVDASWSTAVPIGDMIADVRTTSGRGFQFGVAQYLNERFSYGGNFAWQMFYENDFEVFINEYSVFSGYQRVYVNAFMLTGTSKYYFPTSVNKIKAYISLEIGASAIENYQIMGMYEFKEFEWHFAISPGLGVEIPATKTIGFQLYMKFPYSFKANSTYHYSWINTGVGMYVKIPN